MAETDSVYKQADSDKATTLETLSDHSQGMYNLVRLKLKSKIRRLLVKSFLSLDLYCFDIIVYKI